MVVKIKTYWAFTVKLLFIIKISLLIAINQSPAETVNRDKSENININYEIKIKFYLDQKTKKFLKKMSFKQKMLTQMIRNITDEMQARGKEKLPRNHVGFDLIYGKGKKVLDEYSSEIKAIKDIITELDKLELVIQRKDDLKLLNEVENVKDQLMVALDDPKFGFKNLSNQQIVQKIHEYSKEINSVLKIYDSIVNFQKRASNAGDVQIVKQLEQQKSRIINILEESRMAGTAPEHVVRDYIKEASSIVDILKQIDQLKIFIEGDSSATRDIERVQANIVTAIDERIMNLFGYTHQEDFSGRTISDYYKNWKAQKITEYQVRFTRYRILRDNLINKSTVEERNRMLENEISDALLNYAEAEYELAEMQLRQIYNTYSSFYPNFDGVIFYQSEANYANHYYDSAAKGYLKIIETYPESKFTGQCYLRLLAISYTFNEHEKFFDYYDNLSEFRDIEKDDKNKADYLAAYLMARFQRYDSANEILKNFDSKSKYFAVAQYLHGVVFTNLNKYDEAEKIYKNLVDNKSYPWTDLNISIIKNESLLKLGYMHYERREYEKALSRFTQISKGFPKYDNSLIGQAWTNLKKGQYDFVINKVELLCNNYLMSNYTYEGLVLSAHCKRAQKRTQDALTDLRYVANSKQVLKRMKEYNNERSKILQQLDGLEILEERILEQQNKNLYPKVAKIRGLIEDALTSFRYRGAVSSRMLQEYNNERKIIVRQIETFEKIIEFAEQQDNKEMLANGLKQRNRLVTVLRRYQLKQPISNVSYYLDYPLATKEGGIVYRRGIVEKLIKELLLEKRSIQKDLDIIAELAKIHNENSRIDVTVDLEILEEGFVDLNNQLNSFQVWLANHKIEDIETQTVRWANFSGFGISDINFALLREQNKKVIGLSKNMSKIESLLEKKKRELERRITRFDNELAKIQKEMEKENIRLEKLEKEKYFQEIYFETKTMEIDAESVGGLDEINYLDFQENGK